MGDPILHPWAPVSAPDAAPASAMPDPQSVQPAQRQVWNGQTWTTPGAQPVNAPMTDAQGQTYAPVPSLGAGYVKDGSGKVFYAPPGSSSPPLPNPQLSDSAPTPSGAPILHPWVSQPGAPPPPPPQADPTTLKPDEGLGFQVGLDEPWDNAAQWLENGVKAIPYIGKPIDSAVNSFGAAMGMAPSIAAARQYQQAQVDARANQGYKPGALGQFAGSVAGTLPVTLATANPFLGGAAAGALETNDPNNLQSTATNAVAGGVGGVIGGKVLGMLGGMIAPRLSAGVQTLLGSGVDMTPGQLLGGGTRQFEDTVSAAPLIGPMIKSRQQDALASFNRATINRALEPIGQTVPADVATGHDAIAFGHDAISHYYDSLVPHISAAQDPEFGQELGAVRSGFGQLTPARAQQAENVIQTYVAPKFDPDSGVMSGPDFKSADSQLGQIAARYGKSPLPEDQDYSHSIRGVQGALRGLISRQNPAYAPQLNAANQAFSSMLRPEAAASAVGAGSNGIFTPNMLMGAVKSTDGSLRHYAFSSGNANMQELAGAGKDVLPQTIGSSGTGERNLLLGGIMAAKEGLLNPYSVGAGAIIASPYTKVGGRIAQAAITSRPSWAPQARQALTGLMPGAVAAGSLLPQMVAPSLLPRPAS